jgi:pimeloyl-ACP methyl ester carboxylesterase
MMESSNTSWVDASSHCSEIITVNGIHLHYLDWNGQGEPLLFLSGVGDSAHIFDGFAPQFTDQFRVLALTRRGHGESDKPESGYDLPTLVEDIRNFLDALNIPQVNLVGHSMAGDELTLFTQRYPDRVRKLVYLDSSLKHLWLNDQAEDPLAPPPPTATDFASLANLRACLKMQFGFWSDAQENNLRATLVTLPDGSVRVGLPHRIAGAITRSLAGFQSDASAVRVPTLAFFAVVHHHPRLAAATDEATRIAAQTYIDDWREQQLSEIEFFRRIAPHGDVIELPDAHHYVFIQQSVQVVEKLRDFLLTNKSPS